jgi:hypothetical protein
MAATAAPGGITSTPPPPSANGSAPPSAQAQAADLLALARLDDDGAPCAFAQPRSQPSAESR